jgi:hypothetical protein
MRERRVIEKPRPGRTGALRPKAGMDVGGVPPARGAVYVEQQKPAQAATSVKVRTSLLGLQKVPLWI